MDQAQVALVQRSFDRASRLGAHVAATFYAELFAIDPTLRSMFRGDMIVQSEKLMMTLRALVEGLASPETILPVIRRLAVKHLDYGVEAHHYATVGTALMRTLRHELAAEFTAPTREAWDAAYHLLAEAMIAAAYGQTPAAAI
jgi:hemoglobin-like flavoprotein